MPANAAPDPLASSRQTATIIYALHAAAFLWGITGIIALVMGYVKRGQAEGTWLRSHFDWQIRTFWWSVAWIVFLFLSALAMGFSIAAGSEPGGGEGAMILTTVVLGLAFVALAVWNIYRIARGWMRLGAGQPVP